MQGPMPLHAPSTAEAETSASDRSTFKKPKKKKKKKKKKSKRNAVMVGGGRVGDIQLPDFDAVASAVSGTRVDEKFEDSMAKIANRLRSEPRPVPKKPISARILQAASATATSRGVDVRTGSMVPRQIGRKRANISTEDIETWTTAKRNKVYSIAIQLTTPAPPPHLRAQAHAHAPPIRQIRRIAEAKKRTPKANMISTVQHPGYSSAPGAPTAPAGVSAAGEAPSN